MFRVNIGTKLIVGFAVVIVLMGSVVGVGLDGLGSVARTYEAEALVISESLTLAERVEKSVIAQTAALANNLALSDLYYLDEFDNAQQSTSLTIVELTQRARGEEERQLLARLAESHGAYNRLARPLFGSFMGIHTREFQEASIDVEEARLALMDGVQQLQTYHRSQMEGARATAQAVCGGDRRADRGDAVGGRASRLPHEPGHGAGGKRYGAGSKGGRSARADHVGV